MSGGGGGNTVGYKLGHRVNTGEQLAEEQIRSGECSRFVVPLETFNKRVHPVGEDADYLLEDELGTDQDLVTQVSDTSLDGDEKYTGVGTGLNEPKDVTSNQTFAGGNRAVEAKEGWFETEVKSVLLRDGVLLGIPSSVHAVPAVSGGSHRHVDAEVFASFRISLYDVNGEF